MMTDMSIVNDNTIRLDATRQLGQCIGDYSGHMIVFESC